MPALLACLLCASSSAYIDVRILLTYFKLMWPSGCALGPFPGTWRRLGRRLQLPRRKARERRWGSCRDREGSCTRLPRRDQTLSDNFCSDMALSADESYFCSHM